MTIVDDYGLHEAALTNDSLPAPPSFEKCFYAYVDRPQDTLANLRFPRISVKD